MLCLGGAGRALEEPGRAEKLEGLSRATPEVGSMLHAVRPAQSRQRWRVFQQMAYSFSAGSTMPAGRVCGVVYPVLVGEERLVVSIS